MSHKVLSLPKILFFTGAVLALFPFVSGGFALAGGILFGIFVGNPYAAFAKKAAHTLLALSVIGLGAGMDLRLVGKVGAQGFLYTLIGISVALTLGSWLGKRFNSGSTISTLISVGTAICGGSAIAAVAPAIKAKPHEVSVSLATVFLLNAVALFLFPWIGHSLSLSETQFGIWCALAIHDTSSVIGAAMQFGEKAVQLATTIKLARALWIVPVTVGMAAVWARGNKASDKGRMKRPWFILGFIVAAALVTWVPVLQPAGAQVAQWARRLLVVTLFLIGSTMSRETLKVVGVRPLLQGFFLWIFLSVTTLFAITRGWI